jgi:uncharacterized iron-regulated membrane protein
MSTRVAAVAPRAVTLDRRTVWRWHFYAGLLCVPIVVLLSLTGAVYLFKPEVDAWQERAFDGLRVEAGAPVASADAQVRAAMAHLPGATLAFYELPAAMGAAARVVLQRADGERVRVFVHPGTAAVLGSIDEDARISQFVKTVHGELLLGEAGSWVVELAACWAIVMLLTGLWLWWPTQSQGGAGVWWPRLGRGGRVFWRDLHAVTGVWVSVFALFLLLTGLPWATVWGAAFKEVRTLTGTAAERQDWSNSRAGERAVNLADAQRSVPVPARDEHAEHMGHGAAPDASNVAALAGVPLQHIVDQLRPLDLAAPVQVSRARDGGWEAQSMTQNRPLRVTLRFAADDGRLVRREDFVDRHVIDRAVGIGVAAHEGHLFGRANQLLGLATALALVTLCVSSMVLWWKRRPAGQLGAPPLPAIAVRPPWAVVVLLGVTLPVLGLSLLVVVAIDRLLPRVSPSAARWLGFAPGDHRPSAASATA